MAKFKKLVTDLINNGHAQFDIDLTKEDFEVCMAAQVEVFKEMAKNYTFCTDSYKTDEREWDRGFFRRRRNQKKDDKDCGHFRMSTQIELEIKLGRSIEKDEALGKYLASARKIYLALHDLAVKILKEADDQIPGFRLLDQFLDPEAADLHVLRTIGYLLSKKDRPVADFHYDRDLITLAAYESHKGLHIEEGNRLKPYAHEAGKVLVFWSEKAEVLTKGKLKARVHGVDVFQKDIQRDAIVFFGHTKNPTITKSKPVPDHLKSVA